MKTSFKLFGLLAIAGLIMPSAASALPTNVTFVARTGARDFGPVNAAQRISVTVHLKRPNQALFIKTVDALYDRTSPTFHHWLSDAQLAQFGPSAAQVAAVRYELERNGLSVLSIAGDRSSIRAAGTVAAVSRTFHTAIHQYSASGVRFRANTAPAILGGAAGSYVSLVSGLESRPVKNMLVRATNPKTKQPLAAIPLNKVIAAGGLDGLTTDQMLAPKKTFNYPIGGGLPKATYTGLVYKDYFGYYLGTGPFPDYTPKQLQDVYGLTAAYKQGLTGAGQTIVLLEAYGYPNMLRDANAFSKLTGLPQLNSKNFAVVYPDGVPYSQAGYLTGWSEEISLDIDWAHAIAPGAKILVVASYGQDANDFESAMQYIVDKRLGNVVSDSWEEDTDLLAGPAEQEAFENILIAAAAKGISFQFSTGDEGAYGLPGTAGAAGVPSVAPHATAVGGTSIVNVPGTKSFLNLGWGDMWDIVDGGNIVVKPGNFAIFEGGSGGGSSIFWPKPAWQAALPGYYRQTPDVSALADEWTGVPIVTTDQVDGTPELLVGVGGTSLASPIFTAEWAIANQRAGHSLGQAAPTIAALKKGLIDVLPTAAPYSGAYTDSSGTTKYTAKSEFEIVEKTFGFTYNQEPFATVCDQPEFQQAFIFGFGVDTWLTVTKGWDNVTGYGTPHGLDFINAAASY